MQRLSVLDLLGCDRSLTFGMSILLAARMESTGSKSKIQVSQATADLIIIGGHPDWIKPREEIVFAKGKGDLQTYWLSPQDLSSGGSRTSGDHLSHSPPEETAQSVAQ
jgi:hypothetical protein